MPEQSPSILIIMGVSGIGKTTISQALAADLGWSLHDADLDHPQANVEKMSRGVPLTDEDRQPWLEILAERIRGWLATGRPTLLACSALTTTSRQTLSGGDPRVRFIYLKGDIELVRARLRHRIGRHFMPESLLESQFQTLQAPADAIPIDASESPSTIVRMIRARLGL